MIRDAAETLRYYLRRGDLVGAAVGLWQLRRYEQRRSARLRAVERRRIAGSLRAVEGRRRDA